MSALKALLVLGAAIGVALTAGCGYSTGRIRPEQSRRIGVEIFHNDSKEIDIERLFHSEMTRAVRDHVEASLVDPRRATLVVRGRILDYRRRGGIRSSDNKLLESGVAVTVEAQVYDRLTDEILSEVPPKIVWVGYLTGTFGFENEQEARDRVLRNLADEVVLDLFLPMD